MKSLKKMIAVSAMALFAAGLVNAEDKKAAEPKAAACCAKAEKDGKSCAHGCCVEAAKSGQNCASCGGSGAMAKKEEKK